MVAHGVSRGWSWGLNPQPQRGDRTRDPRNLTPLRGWFPFTPQPTAYAVGYPLPVLRTSRPAHATPAGREDYNAHTPLTVLPTFHFHPLSSTRHA
jgi:hypothetical protein